GRPVLHDLRRERFALFALDRLVGVRGCRFGGLGRAGGADPRLRARCARAGLHDTPFRSPRARRPARRHPPEAPPQSAARTNRPPFRPWDRARPARATTCTRRTNPPAVPPWGSGAPRPRNRNRWPLWLPGCTRSRTWPLGV